MVPGWRIAFVSLVVLTVLQSDASAQTAPGRPGVEPSDLWTCPTTHPIKGNTTTRTGECIYHVRSGGFYDKTKPERCYATDEEARRGGCRKSKR